MPAIATGTVVLWEVVEHANKDDTVEYVSDAKVSVYVANGGEDDDATAILAKYILGEVEGASQKLDKAKELLSAAIDGLLRVGDIKRATVTPPVPR
jgi:hypothetical protein